MAWFYRAIETADGRWECHHGSALFDDHPTLAEALAHLRSLAASCADAVELFVHDRDGRVQLQP